MAERMNEKQIIDSLARAGEFELPQETVKRDIDRVRERLSEREAGQTKRRVSLWEHLMRDRWIRYSAAAVLAIAAIFYFAQSPQLSAEELLTRVSVSMSELKWIKAVNRHYGGPDGETLLSVETILTDLKRRQVFRIYQAGYLHQMDYEQWRWSIYRPADNTMIVKKLEGEWAGPETQVKEYIAKLRQEGIDVRQSATTVGGVRMTVVEFDETLNDMNPDPNVFMSPMMMGGRCVKTIRTKLTIDPAHMQLSSAEMFYLDPADALIVRIESRCEPQESGPSDIYELGVPEDVKIINKVPDDEVESIREQIGTHRKAFLKDYIAVQTESRIEEGTENIIEAMVIYSHGDHIRVDVFRRWYGPNDSVADQNLPALEGSLEWLKSCVPDTSRLVLRSMRIYDGLWQHILDDKDGQWVVQEPQRRPDGDMYRDDDIEDFGWRTLWWLGNPEHMYEDAFSKGNSLAAMELTTQWDGTSLPKRLTLYVDPAKDYLVRRYSEEQLLDASWLEKPIDVNSIENAARLHEEVRVYDVTEYGRTTEGQWYPRTITIKGFDRSVQKNPYTQDFNRISRIYLLQEHPEFSPDCFDSEILKQGLPENP